MYCLLHIIAKSSDGGNFVPLLVFGCIPVFLIFVFYIYNQGAKSRDGEFSILSEQVKKLREENIQKDAVHKLEIKQKDSDYKAVLLNKANESLKLRMEYEKQIENYEKYKESERIKHLAQTGDYLKKINELEVAVAEYKVVETLESEAKREIAEMISMVKTDTMNFPSVSERLLDLYKLFDEYIENRLSDRAFKAKEEVSKARQLARKWKSDYFLTKTRIEVYETMAPWLESYMDCTLEEVLDAKKEEDKFDKDELDDRSRNYLTADEYNKLTEVERNQRALERYWDRRVKRNLWLVGIQYERYVGYLYEKDGYKVVYHGALKGVEDLGVDLIATKGKTTLVIQCKRYSEIKKIPVRENAIAQIYGAAKVYQFETGRKKVIPVMVTSYELSDEARRFAVALGVEVKEGLKLTMYPCIKCNINRVSGERIYHLPFDQQYDTVVIEKDKGEMYVETVQEAHLRGFRRAYRWRGRI